MIGIEIIGALGSISEILIKIVKGFKWVLFTLFKLSGLQYVFTRWNKGGIQMSDEKKEQKRQEVARSRIPGINIKVRNAMSRLGEPGITISDTKQKFHNANREFCELNIDNITEKHTVGLERLLNICEKHEAIMRNNLRNYDNTPVFTDKELGEYLREIYDQELNNLSMSVNQCHNIKFESVDK